MNILNWIAENTDSLMNRKIAISGSTGGLGKEISFYLAFLGAHIILMDRNPAKVNTLEVELKKEFPNISITKIPLDLTQINEVRFAANELIKIKPDIIILNAGAYSIPRCKCTTGLDNVFQINFASYYFLVKKLLPTLRKNGGKVVAVGSIAYNYSKSDPKDIDFSNKNKPRLVYGNAKRYLICSLSELFKNEKSATLSITHPGITFTNITAHYPKFIFSIIKYPMKIIFMSPKKAALSTLMGVFSNTKHKTWIGPRFLNVWGYPKTWPLKTIGDEESKKIFMAAEEIYKKLDRI